MGAGQWLLSYRLLLYSRLLRIATVIIMKSTMKLITVLSKCLLIRCLGRIFNYGN
ncbi:hypothetical protein LRI_2054 (plasmid) [Limosilactobacillus reuteri I5007]|uniref:Uncharacterized protein n=1 Tax=Limosilactobacillus reuteri I5007 TaxID=1340495 RepID=R9WKJ7_LIMRT|nr:hypothetical protein LRI_2054 [Limosilactobacillus reuteri I5007]